MSTSDSPGARAWVALGVLTLAVALLAIDGTVLALAIPALAESLAPSAAQVLWIGDIYSFALAGLLITMGNLADRIGRKRLLLLGSAGFGLSSVLAAFAPSAELLIAARALLGVSGATIMPSTLSMIRNIFDEPRRRTTAIAIWTAGMTGGMALGPLVGGALLEHFWWGSVFLINVPVMVVVLVAGVFLLPESRNPHGAPIDLPSTVLSIAAIVPLVYAIKSAAHDGLTVDGAVALVLGVVAGAAFVRRQRRLAHPLIDLALFGDPAFSGGVAANTIAVFAFSGLLFFFSQYLQLVRGFSPLMAGVGELPASLAAIVVALFIAAVVARIGQGRSIGAGLLAAAVGLVGLAFAEGLPNYTWVALALAVVGMGIGLGTTVATDAILAVAPRERAGAASSISETGFELGVALGIAVLGSLQGLIYGAALTLPRRPPAAVEEELRESLASATAALHDVEGGEELLLAAQEAFVTAMQYTSVVAAVIIAVAGALAWRLVPSNGRRPR